MSFELPHNSSLTKPGFIYGVATAAFQIEGANTADGRCESIWDRFCATPGKVLNGDDGSIACDHYHRLEQDLDLIQSLGVDAYRFSVAWPRIEPAPDQWNEAGFEFYERLIDGLITRGIKPYLTLYHWDLPQYLEDKGGWINRETAYRFVRYAEKITERFGNKVVSYCTFNEPLCTAFVGYRWGIHAPGYADHKLGYQAAHHVLLAHGLALPYMRKNAPEAEHGIVLNFTPAYPYQDTAADIEAVEYSDDADGFWFLHPLMTAEYPARVVQQDAVFMPVILPGDLEIIARPIDFLGINYYSRKVVKANAQGLPEQVHNEHPKTDIGWEIYPDGLTHLTQKMTRRYARLPPLLITENGAADNTEPENGEINDTMRVHYYRQHLLAVHNAVESGVDIRGYFAWSLMDNFEWAYGYSMRFGIVHVDYQSQQRTLKKSGQSWQHFLRQRIAK
ncbi:GH1 family beta-glucosidase [Gynuella sunshinyii]|uniref:Beta-glucosidase n=1 Tax=Gynuella sunshinyii YC6258 TaxID=1445510 RepID=A0A0C5VPU5_9GAMM|nr:GH1 family beta-glucosidase [Gynuella sunshinyii]AJQ92269.1 beta-glucosidase/6-phospho-beta-glucosidase/beta-galactosidase [Gynuella sunshinyii YC6258]